MATISRSTSHIDLDTPAGQAEIARIAGEMRAAMERPPAPFVIESIRDRYGSNAKLAAAMGETRGPKGSAQEKSFQATMRQLQRTSTGATERRGIGPAFAAKLDKAIPKGDVATRQALQRNQAPKGTPALVTHGELVLSFGGGEIEVSSDRRRRDIPPQEALPFEFNRSLRDPIGAIAALYRIPDFTGDGVLTLEWVP